MQTDPTLWAPQHVVTCCVRLHGTMAQQRWPYSLKPVKLLGPCKRTQHCWPTIPNNVESCWALVKLRPFAWALRTSNSWVEAWAETELS